MIKKKKNSAGSIFLKGLIQSFFIVAIMLGAGVISYNTVVKQWLPKEADHQRTDLKEPASEPISAASVDDISKNLIYCYDEEKESITRLVLEIFQCEKKQITYITIPLDTQFTMSEKLYKKLTVVWPAIPQIIRLSSITRYFDQATVFDYGVLVTEDLLGLDISYYTVIPKQKYDAMFSQQYITQGISAAEYTQQLSDVASLKSSADETITDNRIPMEIFTGAYIKLIAGIKTRDELKSYIEALYDTVTSNLSLYEKMNYYDSYQEITLSDIYFERLDGKEYNSGFIIDKEAVRDQLEKRTAY